MFVQSWVNTDETPCTWWCACVAILEFSAISYTKNRHFSIFLCFKCFFSSFDIKRTTFDCVWCCVVIKLWYFFFHQTIFRGELRCWMAHKRVKKSPISRLKTTIYQWIKRRQHNKRLLRDRAAQFEHNFFLSIPHCCHCRRRSLCCESEKDLLGCRYLSR